MEETSIVMRTLLQTLAAWPGRDVLIHEVWADSHTSACVVFERATSCSRERSDIHGRIVGAWADRTAGSTHQGNPARCSWNWLGARPRSQQFVPCAADVATKRISWPRLSVRHHC
jgi:hypothetical protein